MWHKLVLAVDRSCLKNVGARSRLDLCKQSIGSLWAEKLKQQPGQRTVFTAGNSNLSAQVHARETERPASAKVACESCKHLDHRQPNYMSLCDSLHSCTHPDLPLHVQFKRDQYFWQNQSDKAACS